MATKASAPPDLTMMHALHDAFRRDLDHLARHASRRASRRAEDPQSRERTWLGWEIFKAQLYHHHTAEDRQLWPLALRGLADRPDDVAVLDAMESEHGVIDPLVTAVDSAVTTGSATEASDAVDEMRRVIRDHLAHEERDAVPILQRTLTAADMDAFGKQQAKTLGLKGAATVFPWVLEGASDDRVAHVMRELPPPLRFVVRRVWQPRFTKLDRWA